MSSPEKNLALLMILAGPTGTGKTTLCDGMAAKYSGIQRVITCTTRRPRDGEVNGVDYFFLSQEEFDMKVSKDAFLEHAQVHNKQHHYGTLKSETLDKLSDNCDLAMNIDVQGVAAFQKAAENDALLKQRLVTVFLMPRSLEEIEQRLIDRGTDDREEINRRLASAREEMLLWDTYDFCLISGSKEEDFSKIESIWKAEKQRVTRMVG